MNAPRGLTCATACHCLFHDPHCADADIARLRELHVAMDRAILTCYDWNDLDLKHHFYPNERGQTRFTIASGAKRTLLGRLLYLNLSLV
ncbi:MAG: hypothetical protein SNJ69_07915 [Chloroflexaceae bacterium]